MRLRAPIAAGQDPRQPADQQDKRSVIVIKREDVDQWIAGTIAEASNCCALRPLRRLMRDL